MYIKTTKFGGSSLADAEQFIKVAKIIKADPSRRVIVVSAPGKRFKGDEKVTDMLYTCYENASQGKDISKAFNAISKRFIEIAEKLNLSIIEKLEAELSDIYSNILHGKGKAYTASRGEYLNAIILAEYLGYTFIDAARIIKFDSTGFLLKNETYEAVTACFESEDHVVIPGFYGATGDGTIITFPRGGSDITGAVVAAALKVDIYENWTDVSGLMVCDPRIVSNPQPIHFISYKMLRKLSGMGAIVLHEDAILPVCEAGVPIHICNTNAPEEIGTFVGDYDNIITNHGKMVIGLSGLKGYVTVSVSNINSTAFLSEKLSATFKNQDIICDYTFNNEREIKVVFRKDIFDMREAEIKADIARLCDRAMIMIDRDVALISIIGSEDYCEDKAIHILSDKKIDIKLASQDADGIETLIGVNSDVLIDSLNYLYSFFFTNHN